MEKDRFEAPLDKNGRWRPRGGTTFVHSHLYDPTDAAPGAGLDGVLDPETIKTQEIFEDTSEELADVIKSGDINFLVTHHGESLERLAGRLGVSASKTR